MSGISNSVYEEKIKEIRKEIDCLDTKQKDVQGNWHRFL